MQEVKKILIVDDSILARNLLCNAIQNNKECELVQAVSGEDALEKLKDQEFDHYIIDFNMPGMNGLELAEHIREKNTQAHIALCTANIQAAVKSKAENIGIYFISKPVSEEGINDFLSSAA